MSDSVDLLVIGGGAAGFFGAISAAEKSDVPLRIRIVEKNPQVLGKVRISGGGRCNVTHGCFLPKELVDHYPRGARQLIGPFHRWAPGDTMDWFESRGVALKIEDDNRVFPVSDSSESIVECLEETARELGIEVMTHTEVETVDKAEGKPFQIRCKDGETMLADSVLLTTGGIRNPAGADIAEALGHEIVPAAPSLFTCKISDSRLDDLQGVSVQHATASVPDQKQQATGAVLITHWGLSGPAVLKVSALAARELQQVNYHFPIVINWTGTESEEEVVTALFELRTTHPKKSLRNHPQFGIPQRLWEHLVDPVLENDDEPEDLAWPHLKKSTAHQLAAHLTACRFNVDGKSMNKDEFVTCGGVELKGVDFKTMQSRVQPGLFFAGEVLDIDGVTGGFNFQAAWTTAYIAGEAIAQLSSS